MFHFAMLRPPLPLQVRPQGSWTPVFRVTSCKQTKLLGPRVRSFTMWALRITRNGPLRCALGTQICLTFFGLYIVLLVTKRNLFQTKKKLPRAIVSHDQADHTSNWCNWREKEQMRKQMNKIDVITTQIFNVVHL